MPNKWRICKKTGYNSITPDQLVKQRMTGASVPDNFRCWIPGSLYECLPYSEAEPLF